MDAANAVDALLEAPIAPSFSRIGYETRRRLQGWSDLDDYDLTGRVMVVTGATSGLGRAAAEQLARDRATVVVVGRNPTKTERVTAELREATGNDDVSAVIADMGDLASVRGAAERMLADHDRLDVLIHNAGALTHERTDAPDGTEATVASQVVGPSLLTSLLLERLGTAAPGRVITVSSGGMYTAGLTVRRLQMDASAYNGPKQYALAKRAQVRSTRCGPSASIRVRWCSTRCTPDGPTRPASRRRCRRSDGSSGRCCVTPPRAPTRSCGSPPTTNPSRARGGSGRTDGSGRSTASRAHDDPTRPNDGSSCGTGWPTGPVSNPCPDPPMSGGLWPERTLARADSGRNVLR